MSLEWNYPGSRWWKFDFHTHTPASTDTPWHQPAQNSDALTPEQWLLRFMAAEIDCVAVTDHNSGQWVDKLKTAYQQMQDSRPEGFRELFLFPGVEISVNGGFHLLAIFDLSATTRTITDLLACVEYSGIDGDSNGVTKNSPIQVINRVLECGGVPIPAHVDGPKGLLQVIRESRRARIDPATIKQVLDVPDLRAMEFINTRAETPQIFKDTGKHWAKIIGSDNHGRPSDIPLGSRYTWVKMEKPSINGLRLALLDGQGFAIRRSDDIPTFDPLKRPEHFIEAIGIAEAQYMGRGQNPAELKFNPALNTLIGGRGTGKSTIIHGLRLAYQRDQDLPEASEALTTFQEFRKIPQSRNEPGGLQENTKIFLTLNRDGVRHRLTWSQNTNVICVEEWDPAKNCFSVSDSQDTRPQRFPVRLFSQGQIASLTKDGQQALLRIIDEDANTHTHQEELKEAKRSFLTMQAQLRELKGKLKGRDALKLEFKDVQRKIDRFEDAHHAEILKSYQRTSSQSQELNRQFAALSQKASQLRNVASEIIAESAPEGLFDSSQDHPALEMITTLGRLLEQARLQIEAAAAMLTEQGEALQKQFAATPWQETVDQTREDYERLKAELKTQGVSDPSEYGHLVQDKQRLEGEARRLDGLQQQFNALTEQAERQRNTIWGKRRAISQRRTEFLQSVLRDNPFVRINVKPYSCDRTTCERGLRDILNIPRNYDQEFYTEAEDNKPARGLVNDILGGNGEMEEKIKLLQQRLQNACSGAGDFGAKFNKHLLSEIGKRPEFVDHIQCWFPEDGLDVQYSPKGNGMGFKPINHASAGQQAAAMLAFLLAHGTEPLVLDQPEDDLDNHLIYQLVVQQIRDNKQRRQLIIVTHNPNIVVNGDAEMIYVLDFISGQCQVQQKGSLQDDAMREEICNVMEGGREAFDRRYRRIGEK